MIFLRKVDCSMKSKKKSDEKAQVIEIVVDTEDTMTEEERKQWEEDEYLDGGPGNIPNWSRHYKPKEQKKIEDGIQVTVVPVTEEEIAERIKKGNYEWTEYDGDDTAHQFDDLTPEELEEKMEELRKKLFGNKKGRK